ncbi:MAG: hypothetical protein KDD50_16045, partial [Bdellovibrionales bacterium]|nr:hypothetical protein [Bdellovibrionales bacterium]
NMNQFKSDSTLFPLIGDSNQRLIFELKDVGYGALKGEAQARFKNDQSEDDTNSLHGVQAIAQYSEGNGLTISLAILAFENKNEDSNYNAISSVLGFSSYQNPLKDAAKDLKFGYVNPKAFGYENNLWYLIDHNIVKDYELYSIFFEGCWLE